ncbi:hypothetical protein SAMD00023353_8700240 [Rosellinia necatrix]|uniref:Uncharacterized protein n=1 Tax=Rosellinia necatrix TaxID=77044 RepID=A0A1S8AAU0_ROSNE|nr:hypothetical protein SAMD00023353_8700240 [Rosellinia necatrix]
MMGAAMSKAIEDLADRIERRLRKRERKRHRLRKRIKNRRTPEPESPEPPEFPVMTKSELRAILARPLLPRPKPRNVGRRGLPLYPTGRL